MLMLMLGLKPTLWLRLFLKLRLNLLRTKLYKTLFANLYTLTGRPAVSVYPSGRFSHMALVWQSASCSTSACHQDRADMVRTWCGVWK